MKEIIKEVKFKSPFGKGKVTYIIDGVAEEYLVEISPKIAPNGEKLMSRDNDLFSALNSAYEELCGIYAYEDSEKLFELLKE